MDEDYFKEGIKDLSPETLKKLQKNNDVFNNELTFLNDLENEKSILK